MTDLQIISVSKYENELELELCYCEAISSGECFESNNKRTKGNAYSPLCRILVLMCGRRWYIFGLSICQKHRLTGSKNKGKKLKKVYVSS